ncbi:J domain-containing protein [Aphelenchoides fujianensis]|nr:J domain-containing protein [Aphelenchoides fujianensis]
MEPNLYEVLGCSPAASTEQIVAEYRARARQFHPDKQEKTETSQDFQRLQYAKEILCDPAQRQHYDLYLTMGSTIPLAEWMNNREKLKQTMHWGAPREPTLALPPQQAAGKAEPKQRTTSTGSWEKHTSKTIEAFRRYDI